eukprot:jgi/Mesen1/4731/ME000241S03781
MLGGGWLAGWPWLAGFFVLVANSVTWRLWGGSDEPLTAVVRKVVRFEEHVLLLVQQPNASDVPRAHFSLRCLYGNSTRTRVIGVEDDWTARCEHPPPEKAADAFFQFVTLEVDGAAMRTRARYPRKPNWMKLVYAAVAVEDDHLLLFAKGVVKHKKQRRPPPASLRTMKCLFNGMVRTDVVAACQENFLCKMPPRAAWGALRGRHLTLEIQYYNLPSVVTFQPELTLKNPPSLSGVPLTPPLLRSPPGLGLHPAAAQPAVDSNAPLGRTEEGRHLLAVPSLAPPGEGEGVGVGGGAPVSRGELQWRGASAGGLGGWSGGAGAGAKPHLICVCTMVWDSAKFVREWVTYHARMGVSRFLIYDNNSEDELARAVEGLAAAGFAVTRHLWPWMKTQEAGFSHCAVRAQDECEWLMYIDVDEFVFPGKQIRDASEAARAATTPATVAAAASGSREAAAGPDGSGGAGAAMAAGLAGAMAAGAADSPLGVLLKWSAVKVANGSRLGNLKIVCQNFGPSGLRQLPASGQMVNYVCREARTSRHKSIVATRGIDPTRCNFVHRFDLRPGYSFFQWRSVHIAAIKHYKFQVWEDFRQKFRRRVATFVKDWKLDPGKPNRDRVDGLDSDEVEPEDWPGRFCEVNDTGIRDYALEHFRDPASGLMLWEL